MAIAIQIPFPRAAVRASGDRPGRAISVTAQPGARVYSPYGRRRLARPMAVPDASSTAIRTAGGRYRLTFFRSRRS